MYRPVPSSLIRSLKAAVFIFLCALVFCWSGDRLRAADPAAVTSEYYSSIGGVFTRELDGTTRMWVVLQPIKLTPGAGPIFLEISYENPHLGAPPLIDTGTIRVADKRKPVVLRSPPLTGLRAGRNYLTTVKIYADEAHTQLLGTHTQATANHVPASGGSSRRSTP